MAGAFCGEVTTGGQAQEQPTNLSSNPTARVAWNEPHASPVRVVRSGNSPRTHRARAVLRHSCRGARTSPRGCSGPAGAHAELSLLGPRRIISSGPPARATAHPAPSSSSHPPPLAETDGTCHQLIRCRGSSPCLPCRRFRGAEGMSGNLSSCTKHIACVLSSALRVRCVAHIRRTRAKQKKTSKKLSFHIGSVADKMLALEHLEQIT